MDLCEFCEKMSGVEIQPYQRSVLAAMESGAPLLGVWDAPRRAQRAEMARLRQEFLRYTDEIERLQDLLNTTAANNRTKARELRRLKHTDEEG